MHNHITADELKQRMAAGERMVLLDVRQQDEWDEFHLEGALHIPLPQLEERLDDIEEFRDKEIIVYCRSGNRSSEACMFLEMVGFSHPVNLQGGVKAW